MSIKMKNYEYDTPDDIRTDMELLVANCKHYNEEDSEIYAVRLSEFPLQNQFQCAEQIEEYFTDRLKEIFEHKKRRR